MNEYAPQYTTKERIALILKAFALLIPLHAFCYFWFFDWLSSYASTAHCQQYGPVNGLHLLFYGLFVGLPLSVSVVLFLAEGRRSLRVLKVGQNPLPGEKVFKPTKYRYGKRAKILPLLVLLCIAYFAGFAVWGAFQAKELTREIPPCDATVPESD